MKARLPKTLLLAVLAAMAVGTTEAGYYTIGGVIGVDENGNAVTEEIAASDIPSHEFNDSRQRIYAPIVKDGAGTLTITTGGSFDNDLFIREGQFVVKANTNISYCQATDTTHPMKDANGNILVGTWGALKDAQVQLAVGGKDAVMEVDGAEFNLGTWGTAINVGCLNGNGKLILKNNAKLSHYYGFSTYIGYPGYVDEKNVNLIGWQNGHATTTTTTGDDTNPQDRYVGNYTPGSLDSSRLFGRGEVLVTGQSYADLGGMGGIYIGEGTLTIEDGSTVVSGTYHYHGARTSSFGMHSGAMSIVNVTGKSTFDMKCTSDQTTDIILSTGETGKEAENGFIENSKTIINVDDSVFSVAKKTRLSAHSDNTTATVMNLTNSATAKFADLTVGSESGKSTAVINIDAASTMTAYDGGDAMSLTINHGEVNNAGTIEAGEVSINKGGNLTMTGSAAKLTADSVTVGDGGALSVAAGSDATVSSDVEVGTGGSIVLNNGNMLNVSGSLTLGKGAIILLNGGYESGDVLVAATDGLEMSGAEVKTTDGRVSYTLTNGNQLQLTGVFSQSVADTAVLANWGTVTASRAFVNTVRGQRTNTGCIANGRGTAWVSVLGATHDIAGADINQRGAAVGADMKVGRKCSLGVAFGYVDGDVKPNGLRSADQSGTYMALYGEHGLKQLSPTSCLSLDWVAAYGRMESEQNGIEWNQDSLQFNTRLSWNKQVTDRLSWNAFAGLEYYTNESDTAEGIKSGSIQNLRGELGVGVSYVAWGSPDTAPVVDAKGGLVSAGTTGCKKLVLHGELRYMNDMVRSNPVVEMDGMRGGATNPGRQGVGIEAGATYRFSERWSSSVNYGFNAMDDSREHRVNVGASYTF